jgi:hypothetical protein
MKILNPFFAGKAKRHFSWFFSESTAHLFLLTFFLFFLAKIIEFAENVAI